MRHDDLLDELPEAVPLHRIAPFWRLIAIVAAVAAVALLFVVLVLGIALVNTLNRPTTVVTPPGPVKTFQPVPPAIAMAGGGFGSGAQDEAAAEAQNLPYPVTAELGERDPYEPVEEN